MSELSKVEQRSVGYYWSFKIEREVRKLGADAKYSDKDLITASLGGNEETYDKAVSKLIKAKVIVEESIKSHIQESKP